MKKKLLYSLFSLTLLASSCLAIDDATYKKYKDVTEETSLINAVEMLKNTTGSYSRDAILGKNLTNKPILIQFIDLSTISPAYANFDALGWKKKKRLIIYINEKHKDAPIEALSAILAHEAIHQDTHNSLNEETYAWTLEAAVWTQLSDDNPHLEKISHPLVERENFIKQLFIRGDHTDEYISKFVKGNRGYKNLPERSYGFEDL